MIVRLFSAVLLCLVAVLPATAQEPSTPESREAEERAAWDAALKAAKVGPVSIPLAGQGAFQVPADTAFIPLPEAARAARAMGNVVSPDFLGLVVGKTEWIAFLSFRKEGYVEDGDAKEWQADELLDGLRKGTEAANHDRATRGFPALDITGWVQPPAYEAATHRLVWSLGVRERGEPASKPQTVNYNTYVLGREGYFSLDFVTSSDKIEAEKPTANTLLANLSFDQGKRYEDFDSSTDKVAAYGLAALVGGVALKKIGFFALAAAFMAKFAKAGILLVFGLFAGLRRFFRRKPANPA